MKHIDSIKITFDWIEKARLLRARAKIKHIWAALRTKLSRKFDAFRGEKVCSFWGVVRTRYKYIIRKLACRTQKALYSTLVSV